MGHDIFADLNHALFVQMDKLQAADQKDENGFEKTIQQSRAVSALAENVIANNNSKIAAMRFFEGLSDNVDSMARQRDKMLGDGGHGA